VTGVAPSPSSSSSTSPPGGSTGPVVGVVGGGQLARMLAEAATPLGVRLRVLAGPHDEGAREVVPDTVTGSPDDPEALLAFARTVDVVTFDHENVDHDVLERIEAEGTPVRPGVATLRCSDKAHQRRLFAGSLLPVPDFEVLDADATGDAVVAAEDFARRHGGQVVVKASRGGYDGRGVWMLDADELPAFLGAYRGAPLVLEPRLDLRCEVAVLVARRPSGEVRTWPLVETVQVDGMCDEVLLPAPVGEDVAALAAHVGARVAEVAGAVGVLAVELFVVDGPDGRPRVLVNEIAPRVHNSGHVTIEACRTSQFEQHLRAVLDWPLGPTEPVSAAAAMVNVVGSGSGEPRHRQAIALAAVPGAHVHLYGKTPRPARKIGHVTVLGHDLGEVRAEARRAADLLAGVDPGADAGAATVGGSVP
jgi:5-(carboxyamino)imidazole ribonucleotide synthase